LVTTLCSSSVAGNTWARVDGLLSLSLTEGTGFDALVLGLNRGLGPDDAGLVRLIVERKAM